MYCQHIPVRFRIANNIAVWPRRGKIVQVQHLGKGIQEDKQVMMKALSCSSAVKEARSLTKQPRPRSEQNYVEEGSTDRREWDLGRDYLD